MKFDELCQIMESEGWFRKDFKNSEHYRGWYYRNHKKVEISGAGVIDHPQTFWYRPILPKKDKTS